MREILENVKGALKRADDIKQYIALKQMVKDGLILKEYQQKKLDAYEERIEAFVKVKAAMDGGSGSGFDVKDNAKGQDTDPEEQEPGIPVRLRVKRRYTMSEAALAQRRAATHSAAKCAAMAGNRNGWKHGHFADNFINKLKPCKSTCPQYPCRLVEGGEVEPGDDCLDKVEVIGFFRAVHNAVKNKDYDDFNELASLQIANTIKVVDMLIEDIFRDGTVLQREKTDKDGNHIATEYVTHPSLLALPKLIADLGLNPAEFLITPRSKKRSDVEEEGNKTLAELMSRAAGAFKGRPGYDPSDDDGR